MWKNQDGFPIKTVGNDRVGKRLFVVRSVVDSLEKGDAPWECQKEGLDKPVKYDSRETQGGWATTGSHITVRPLQKGCCSRPSTRFLGACHWTTA